jgi:EAL domain-containing protein (putative c-di-GMP-specific phosphodiesterase class I)
MLGSSSSLTVWVNISARQLSRPDLEEAVAEAIGRSGADPASILLEITERGMMSDADAASRALWSLRALGVRLAVDDFGTGYSSLVHLRQFPLNSVKVDRTFVAGLGRDRECDAIVNAVVGLSHALGLTVVGEGVENDAQLRALRAVGCDYAQGFRFALPASSEQIAELLREDPAW